MSWATIQILAGAEPAAPVRSCWRLLLILASLGSQMAYADYKEKELVKETSSCIAFSIPFHLSQARPKQIPAIVGPSEEWFFDLGAYAEAVKAAMLLSTRCKRDSFVVCLYDCFTPKNERVPLGSLCRL